MAGKVPNLEPQSSGLRLPKTVRVYWSPFFQRWIVKAANRSNGGNTPNRLYAQQAFTATTQLIKSVSPEDRVAQAALAQNTTFLDRDLMMKAASGTLIQWTDETGKVWVGRAQVYPDIQAALDSITTIEGAILVRTSEGWLGLLPGTSQQVLTIDPVSGMPLWMDSQGGGGGANGGIVVMPPAGGAFSETSACVGHFVTPQQACTITSLTCQFSSVAGGQYRLGIAKVNPTTKVLLTAPVYTPINTVVTANASDGMTGLLDVPTDLAAGETWWIFLNRIDSTTSATVTLYFSTTAYLAVNFHYATGGVAWQLRSLAPAIGDALTSAGTGYWTIGMIFNFPTAP